MNEPNEIKVIESLQIATIDDRIVAIVDDIKNEIANLNIGSMVVSEENKQTLKNVRADLNKKLATFESERKKIKDFILQPYNDFESKYKTQLKSVIDEAINQVDEKVKIIEAEQKNELESYAREYFDRKLISNPLEFGNEFESVDLKITLTINKKKIREAIDFHFEKVSAASLIIANHPHSVRLRSIFMYESGFDIGIALTKLEKQLSREREYQATVVNEIPKEMTVTKVPSVEEKISQPIMEELFDFKLKISVTETELKKLNDFLEKEGIIYELSEN